MKKITLLLAIAVTITFSTILCAYVATGTCDINVDGKTTVEYTWDCCAHGGKAQAMITFRDGDGREAGWFKYEASIDKVRCYKNCCPNQ